MSGDEYEYQEDSQDNPPGSKELKSSINDDRTSEYSAGFDIKRIISPRASHGSTAKNRTRNESIDLNKFIKANKFKAI